MALMTLVGCGGGGGGSDTNPTSRDYSFDVNWQPRSRAIEGPSAALSFRMTLEGAQANGQDYVFNGTRSSARPEAHTQNYTFRANLRPITTTMRIDFFSGEPAGTGDIVGTASAQVNLANTQFVGNVNTTSRITAVSVIPLQTLTLGATRDLSFEARNQAGQLVAVSPGSAIWTSSNTGILRFENGRAVGVAEGNAQVTATVNGIQSAPVNVQVVPVAVNTSVRVFAAVPNTAPYQVTFTPTGGAETTLFTSTTFATFTSYTDLLQNEGRIRVLQNGTQRSSRLLTFNDETRTSIVIAGTPTNTVIVPVREPLGVVANGEFRLRFVLGYMASRRTFDIYVLQPGQTVATTSPVRTERVFESGFVQDLPAGATQFAITEPGSKTVVFSGDFQSPNRADVTLVLDETSEGIFRYNYWGTTPP